MTTAFDPHDQPPHESFADRETTDVSSALLQGRGLQDVTIAGPGRIDGNRRSRGGPKPIAPAESRDDAIVLESSLALGVRRSTEYVVVTDCDLVNVRNGLKFGTESSGEFRNIVFRNCTLSGRAGHDRRREETGMRRCRPGTEPRRYTAGAMRYRLTSPPTTRWSTPRPCMLGAGTPPPPSPPWSGRWGSDIATSSGSPGSPTSTRSASIRASARS